MGHNIHLIIDVEPPLLTCECVQGRECETDGKGNRVHEKSFFGFFEGSFIIFFLNPHTRASTLDEVDTQ